MPFSKRIFTLVMVTFAFLLLPLHALAQEETEAVVEAVNVAQKCSYSSSAYVNSPKLMYDKSLKTGYKTKKNADGNYLELSLPEDENVQGIYIKWEKAPGKWELWFSRGDEEFEFVQNCGIDGFVQEYVAIPEGSTKVKFVSNSGAENVLSILELEVYTQGELPETVHIWSKAPETVDFLVVSTHQDDEVLFFGGTIPYYVGEKKIDTLVVYMAFDEGRRLHEACDALWYGGCRYHPEFAMFPDAYSLTLKDAKRTWDEDEVTDYLTKIVLTYRPNVILTQHTDGEYGHGQHRLTVHCLKNAVENAASKTVVAEKFPSFTTWDTPKLYMHANSDDYTMKIMWDDIILESFGGITALDAAQESFRLHVSQNYTNGFRIHYDDRGRSDCTLFTLYRTNVGEDIENNDFFENITLRAGYAEILQEDLDYIATDASLVRISENNLYSVSRDDEAEYIRYCSSGGIASWYLCDENGTLLEPVSAYRLVPPAPASDVIYVSDTDLPNDYRTEISVALCVLSIAVMAVVLFKLIRKSTKKSK